MNSSFKINKLFNSRKGTSPIIATLLLVSIAVVGGVVNFTMSQEYFNTAQASGLSGIESLIFLGYDATDSDRLTYHDGINSNPVDNWHGSQLGDGLKVGERVGIYVQNNSVKEIHFKEIMLAGNVYEYQEMNPNNQMTSYSNGMFEPGEYTIVINGNENAPADTLSEGFPVIQPGQSITLVLELENSFQIGRDIQFRLTTTNGGVFVYSLMSGNNLG